MADAMTLMKAACGRYPEGSRGRTRRRRLFGTAFGLVALATGAAVLSVTFLQGADAESAATAGSPSIVSGHGLSLEIPAGWDGRITQESPQDAIVLEAASVPLAEDDATGAETQKSMREGDLYIKLIDINAAPSDVLGDPSWSEAVLPVEIRASDISPVFEGVELPAYAARFPRDQRSRDYALCRVW